MRSSIKKQFFGVLMARSDFGTSKHKARANAGLKFGQSDFKIYSYSTFDNYREVSKAFADYLVERGYTSHQAISSINLKNEAKLYIMSRIEQDLSPWTLKKERSALSMLIGERLEIDLPKRERADITRSREPVEVDKHFSSEKNKDVILIAKSTGCRRSDLERLRYNDFYYNDGKLFCKIEKSKGGRDRNVYVLNADEVLKTLNSHALQSHHKSSDRVFGHINSAADIHSFRREYALDVFKAVEADKTLKQNLLTLYPPREENVATKTYKPRNSDKVFDRDSLFIVSQSLGHNRLDVTLGYIN